MNIIDVLNTEIAKWNDPDNWGGEARCGLCWEFVPGGRPDYFNNIQLREDGECCVYVGVLSIAQTSGISVRNQHVEKTYCDWSVRIIAGIPSRLDIQFYNENPDHPVNESKWDKYIKNIFQCFGGGCIEMDLCDIHNCKGETRVEIVRWNSEMVMNYKDYNLDGVIVNAVFREWY